ncbi:MAG: FlxA-like family protein [Lachnospiraceae bacterium]|nr:FlxA-like family protein [Lachnospiraceae bacterium]
MTINSINGANTQMGQMGMNQATDPYSRNIQSQIANAQKQLKELSSNSEMTLEEKMKKRQGIQQQISDLNMQLRQHQMEQRKEKQQAKGSSMDEMLGATGNAKAGSKNSGLSQASMTAMISADNSIKQAKVQGSVATSMEGRAGVLKLEIKTSEGASLEKKKDDLADIEQRAQEATSSQLSTLAEANKTMEDAAKADSKEEKADNKDAKTAGASERATSYEKDSDEKVSGVDNTHGETVSSSTAAETTSQQPTTYTSVDIRL